MSQMKALFLSESQGFSGGAKQLIRLAMGIGAFGWDVAVACPGNGETFQRAARSGLKTIDLHPREDYDVVSAVRLSRLIEREGFDILHAHHPRAHAVGLVAAYLTRRNVGFVVTRRVSFGPKRNPFSLFKYRSRRIDGYIAVAESIRQGLIASGVEPDRVATIPSTVDLARFAPRPRDAELARALALPPGAAVVGKLANYGSWKGQDVALAAAAQLKREGRRLVFLFAGRDTDGPEIRRKAAAFGLKDGDARFLGFREDVPELLSLLDVSVNASTEGEGLSGALRESLAMGVPVVATDAGGNRELVEHGVTGRLATAGDPAALARSIAATLDDLDAARRQAQEGRRRVVERFGAERLASATARFYETVLARRSRLARKGSSSDHAAETGMSRHDSQEPERT
ncbi:MAG: glycosyltransferase family 4 protein [Elusimicrobia bacterium]|nr:glycosyltransferase family 4 protein [Elusimicrobiota bacterium]